MSDSEQKHAIDSVNVEAQLQASLKGNITSITVLSPALTLPSKMESLAPLQCNDFRSLQLRSPRPLERNELSWRRRCSKTLPR